VSSGADAGAGAGSPKASKNDKDGLAAEPSGGFFSFAASSLIDGLMRALPVSSAGPDGDPLHNVPPVLSSSSSHPGGGVGTTQMVASVAAGGSAPSFGQQGSMQLQQEAVSSPRASEQKSSLPTSSSLGGFLPTSIEASGRSVASSSQGAAQQDPLTTARLQGLLSGIRDIAPAAQPWQTLTGRGNEANSSSGVPGSLLAVEKRIAQLEDSLKGIEALLKERQNDSSCLPELEEQLKALATQLVELKSGRKSLEDRAARIKSSLAMEHEEREAWLKAFKSALGKSLSDLDICVDNSIAESSKAMMTRLGAADAMMLKLINRVDEIQWARESVSRMQTAAGGDADPRVGEVMRGIKPSLTPSAMETSPTSSAKEDSLANAREMVNAMMGGMRSSGSTRHQSPGPGTPKTVEQQLLDQKKSSTKTKEAEPLGFSGKGASRAARSVSPSLPNSKISMPMESAKLLQDWTDVFHENLRLQQVRTGLINQRRKQRSNTSKSVGASPAITPDHRRVGAASMGASPSTTPKSKGVGDLTRRIDQIMANLQNSSPRGDDAETMISKARTGTLSQANTGRASGSVRLQQLPTVAEGSANAHHHT